MNLWNAPQKVGHAGAQTNICCFFRLFCAIIGLVINHLLCLVLVNVNMFLNTKVDGFFPRLCIGSLMEKLYSIASRYNYLVLR